MSTTILQLPQGSRSADVAKAAARGGDENPGVPYSLSISFAHGAATFEIRSGSTGKAATGTFAVDGIPDTTLSFPEQQ